MGPFQPHQASLLIIATPPIGQAESALEIIRPVSSSAFLAEGGALRRAPIAPERRRAQGFWDQFEDRALFYDCFRHVDGERVVLVGPPALNLSDAMEEAVFTARPSGRALGATLHPSRSTLIVELSGAQAGDESIAVTIGGQEHGLAIAPNLAGAFAGRRVMVTMNKDNDPDWIAGWARWHQRVHGVDAIIMFDNGSTRHGIDAVTEALARVRGLAVVALLSWPWRYGRKDPALLDHPHYVHFLQVSSLNVALRRFAAKAAGLLNCDIDELVGSPDGRSAFDHLAESPDGLVTLKGKWVEAIATHEAEGGVPHLRYRAVHRNPFRAVCANKWIIDPGRDWLAPLSAKPSVHRIYDVPRALGRTAPVLPFWHFRAINTHWKEDRSGGRSYHWVRHRLAGEIDATIARVFGA